jgi:hypothetical protein
LIERLAVDAKDATDLGSISASSDTMESEGQQMKKAVLNNMYKKKKSPQNTPLLLLNFLFPLSL